MKLRLPARFQDMTLAMLQAIETGQGMLPVLEACTGQPQEQLRQLPQVLLQEGYAHVLAVREQETPRHLTQFALEGTEYGFIPDWGDFTAGEWIDAETYSNDFWPNAHKLMSVLFRPIDRAWGDSYTIAPYTAKEGHEAFLNMPADQVAGALVFFWTTRNERLATLRSSLRATATRRMPSHRNGGGTLSFLRWPTRRILKWMRSHAHRWGIYSRTWRF